MDKGLSKKQLTDLARSVLRDVEVRTAGQKEGVALLHQKLIETIETDDSGKVDTSRQEEKKQKKSKATS